MASGELVLTTTHGRPALPPGEWPQPGCWTVQDWENLPRDEFRYEVIDGVLYVTSAPSPLQQWTSDSLVHQLRLHLGQHSPPPGILFSATGVVLPVGALIPDVVYVTMPNIHIVDSKRIVGVPNLVIEIASPGTAGYDRREKQDAYARSAVPEYWWIDPANRTVEVLVLEDTGRYRAHALVEGQATVPSLQLPGLQFPVERLFMPQDLVAALRQD